MIKKLPEAIDSIEQEKAEPQPDQKVIDALQERVNIWRKEIRWTGVMADLHRRIEDNPYPGEQKRLLSVACSLMPDINEHEWCLIFDFFRIDRTSVYYFPVTIDTINIESIEQQLLALMNDDNVIPASSLELVIQSSPNSKQYRNTKHQLQQRGWYWNRRRKLPTSVIQPPCNRTQRH